ncbi:hypothetical protein AcV7_003786 [Taiwanofungus camphoratus]|nr:hypothetical protein AcV7_003786 [Antrodia cinnamomea]
MLTISISVLGIMGSRQYRRADVREHERWYPTDLCAPRLYNFISCSSSQTAFTARSGFRTIVLTQTPQEVIAPSD